MTEHRRALPPLRKHVPAAEGPLLRSAMKCGQGLHVSRLRLSCEVECRLRGLLHPAGSDLSGSLLHVGMFLHLALGGCLVCYLGGFQSFVH